MEPEQNDNPTTDAIEAMVSAINQERFCPNILEFQTRIFEHLSHELNESQKKLQNYIANYEEYSMGDKNFLQTIYQMEMDQVSYLLKTYLRVRLSKIQYNALWIVKYPRSNQMLSPTEQYFVRKYAKNRYDYYYRLVLKDLHKEFRGLNGVEDILGKSIDVKKEHETKQTQIDLPKPNLTEYKFLMVMNNPRGMRYNQDIGVINVRRDERPLLERGDVIFAPYSEMENLHVSGCGRLI